MSSWNEANILEAVRGVLRDKLRVTAPIEPSTDLQGDLQLDSLKLLALVVELENHFEVCFEPGDEHGIATIEQLVRKLAGILAQSGAATAP